MIAAQAVGSIPVDNAARDPVDNAARDVARARPHDRKPGTFFGVPSRPDLDKLDARVALLGVPYDGNRSATPTGRRAGPAAARAATQAPTERDRVIRTSTVDVGDVQIDGSGAEANYRRITTVARRIVERGAAVGAVGGDHSISYPLGRGMEPLGPIDIVHIDSHADFLHLDGAHLNGASQLRRLAELPFVSTVSALGIRNADDHELRGMREVGGRWATSLDVLERGPAEVVRDVVPESDALYVSIDLDVLDCAPGHSLRELGGLAYRQLRDVLAEVALRGRLIGFDIVELNPARDRSGAMQRVGTWIIGQLVRAIAHQR